jgi:hypothetical protein
MASAIKEGDRVQIVDRQATVDDAKSNLFFNHFRGLTGTVQKVYASEEMAVEIENEALPEPVANRHHDVQEAMKTKWLDGLSEEGRNRLTPQERDFRLRYTVLVAGKDVVAAGAKPTPAETAARKTEAELSAAEEAELKRRQAGRQK